MRARKKQTEPAHGPALNDSAGNCVTVLKIQVGTNYIAKAKGAKIPLCQGASPVTADRVRAILAHLREEAVRTRPPSTDAQRAASRIWVHKAAEHYLSEAARALEHLSGTLPTDLLDAMARGMQCAVLGGLLIGRIREETTINLAVDPDGRYGPDLSGFTDQDKAIYCAMMTRDAPPRWKDSEDRCAFERAVWGQRVKRNTLDKAIERLNKAHLAMGVPVYLHVHRDRITTEHL